MENNLPKISFILPCRNEEQALPACLQQIKKTIQDHNLSAEIIVSDSSDDRSPEIALQENITLIKHHKAGYGSAYLEAFKKAKGTYIIMADADCTYDFGKAPDFVKELDNGWDLVIGNRLSGNIEKGAMPVLNRYLGTPVLSYMLKILFGANIKDSQSGMRAIKKTSLEKLDLRTTGMEFASEMIIKALKHNLKIKEITINYHKRIGRSKLKPFSDAWQHMRFMLLYSPLFLFFIPGLILFLIGILSMIWLWLGPITVFDITFYYHPMFLSSLLMIIGYQLIIFSGFAKIYSITHLKEKSEQFEKLFQYVTIEKASLLGLVMILAGIIIYIIIAVKWFKSNFGTLQEVKNSIIALTLLTIGTQTIFSSFMLSILGIKEQ